MRNHLSIWLMVFGVASLSLSANEKPRAPMAETAALTTKEAERFVNDVVSAYESHDIQRFMSFIPTSAMGRDSLQEAVIKDYAALQDIRVQAHDLRVVSDGEIAIVEAFFSRKAIRKEDSKPVSREAKSQLRLLKAADGHLQLEPKQNLLSAFSFVGQP